MKNKNTYIAVAVVVIILLAILALKSNKASAPENTAAQNQPSNNSTGNNTANTSGKISNVVKIGQRPGTTKPATGIGTVSNLPDLDLIDKMLTLNLKDYPDVRITIEKVAFGRGAAIISPKCSGVPNVNFSTYLYPGDSICINPFMVDGSPGGIVAFHLLIENKGQLGFGGNSSTFKLHYIRANSSGALVNKFASALIDLGSYYLNPYTSKEVVFSYMVPQDQLVYDFVAGYNPPTIETKDLNAYDFSSNGILVDFSSNSLKIVK